MDVWAQLRETLDRLEASQLLRCPAVVESPCGPRVRLAGREVVCLCSNDYLGLANDASVKAAAIEAIGRWGVGAGSSRLVAGTTVLHAQLESALAAFEGTPAAVVTSTGWQANAVAMRALAGPGDLVLADKLNHASILDAVAAGGAAWRTYPHADTTRLHRLLDRHRARCRRCVIVTDSLFSMDGDLAPLAELADLKRRYDALLVIDEAHATGVLGEQGRGAAQLLGVESAVDATVGTLSKALGAMGGFVAGPAELIDTIRNAGREYVYTTALPAALCAAALASLEIVRTQPQRRRVLLERAAWLRRELTAAGLDVGRSASQIIPVMVGEAGAAVELSGRLLEAGFWAPAIRPPTVPRGTSRLRISLCAAHEQADLERLVQALRDARPATRRSGDTVAGGGARL